MKSPFRLSAVLVLALACAAPALAQESESKASQPWMKLEKELGLQTTYSVDMVMQAMGMNVDSRTVRDGGKTRTEMTMPFMNLKMVALEFPKTASPFPIPSSPTRKNTSATTTTPAPPASPPRRPGSRNSARKPTPAKPASSAASPWSTKASRPTWSCCSRPSRKTCPSR